MRQTAKSRRRLGRKTFGEASAFSLVELIVVLVIIGIMTGVIVAEMKGTFEDALLRSSARKVVSAVTLAHSQAATAHRPHRFSLDAATGRYRIDRWRNDPVEGDGFVPIHQVPGAEGSIDPRISIEIRDRAEETAADSGDAFFKKDERDETPASRGAILFSPDGTAEPMEILLRDRSGVALSLRINPATSRVRITSLERDAQ